MAKMNYDRPRFKYIDNLNRIRNEISYWYEDTEKTVTPSSKSKHLSSIKFMKKDWETCDGLLKSLEKYYVKSSEALQKMKLSKIKPLEEELTATIRKFALASLTAKVKKEENSGIFKFYDLLVESLPTDDLFFELLSQELEEIGKELENQANK